MAQIESHPLPNSTWACGCSDDLECDGTCRLNEEWALLRAKDSFSILGSTVAVLFSNTTSLSTYMFTCSDDNIVSGTFHSSDETLTKPFTTGTDLMTLDWMHRQLLQFPDTFIHSSLERAALTETVVRLQRTEESQMLRDDTQSCLLQRDRTAINIHPNSPNNTENGDDYVQIYPGACYMQNIQPRQDWQPDNIVATLSVLAESVPLLQRQDSAPLVRLYEFKLTEGDTLTASTHDPEIEAAWHKGAQNYGLQRNKGNFALTDLFCILQARVTLPIPPEEVTALKECVHALATEAVQRLEHPKFTLLRDRNPILQCELITFTLCLRKEIAEQSEMWIQSWLSDQLYTWKSGQISQVMTTETQKSVDVTITQERDKQTGPKYQILRHMAELNHQGAFFRCEGLGGAGKILILPE